MQNKLKLVLSLLALTISLSINATIISGSCGDNATYRLEDDHILYIEGSGDMWNRSHYGEKLAFPWKNNELEIQEVLIYGGITSIASSAFQDCRRLTYIFIPNSVTNIGDFALQGCSSLTSISIPNSVTSIGNNAFYGCSSLTSISVPNSVTSIGKNAFYGCSSLTSFSIPNSVTNIGYSTFAGCSSLTSVIIPNSVTSIGDYAFYGCSSLTSVGISNSVTSIGDYAFWGCSSLTSIGIPNTVISVGESAFGACHSLSSIIVNSSNNNYSSIDGVLFDKDKKELICFPSGKKESNYIIPNSVTNIEDDAFLDCSSLTSISIPNSVTNIGYSTFAGCSSLTSISIPNSVISIGEWAFDGCSSLTSISIPNSVTSIGEWAFANCSSLTSIDIPNSVKSIGERAFYKCSSLSSILIPNSVTSIGYYAFEGCTNVKDLVYADGSTAACRTYLTSINSVTIPYSVTSISYDTFYGCSKLREIHVKSVTPPNAFNSAFEGVSTNYCKLYVPIGSKESYAFAKGWQNFMNIIEENVPVDGGENQCAAPTIAYEDGALKFYSTTPNATFIYTISDADMKSAMTACENGVVDLVAAYEIIVYANAEGCSTSEPSTATLCWLDGTIKDAQSVKAITSDKRPVLASCREGMVEIKGLANNEIVTFHSVSGQYIGQAESVNGEVLFDASANSGKVLIGKIGNNSIKILVK